MFWVLQNNLMAEDAHRSLVDQLERQRIQFQIVSLIPFARVMEPDISPEGFVFPVGSTAMKNISLKKGWNPGYIDENIDYSKLLRHYRGEMLNYGAQIVKFKNIDVDLFAQLFNSEQIFIRPVLDNKSFTGQLMSWEELRKWQRSVIELEEQSSFAALTGNDEVVLSPPKKIYAEYRFLTIRDRLIKIVTGSQYKLGQQVISSDKIDREIFTYALGVVDAWCPNAAFCIDVAMTPDGPKVLEINSVNSAGFYAMDMGKYVDALNQLVR